MMKEDVSDDVKACVICGQKKSCNSPLVSLLQPLTVPSQPWADIAMDFVTGLPPEKDNSIMLTIINMFDLLCSPTQILRPWLTWQPDGENEPEPSEDATLCLLYNTHLVEWSIVVGWICMWLSTNYLCHTYGVAWGGTNCYYLIFKNRRLMFQLWIGSFGATSIHGEQAGKPWREIRPSWWSKLTSTEDQHPNIIRASGYCYPPGTHLSS